MEKKKLFIRKTPVLIAIFSIVIFGVLSLLVFPSLSPPEFIGWLYWLGFVIIFSLIWSLGLSSRFTLYIALTVTVLGAVFNNVPILSTGFMFWLIGITQTWLENLKTMRTKKEDD